MMMMMTKNEVRVQIQDTVIGFLAVCIMKSELILI